jgi:hypothetical protein
MSCCFARYKHWPSTCHVVLHDTNTDPVHVMLFCTIQTLTQYMSCFFARYKQTLTQYMSCCFALYKHWPSTCHVVLHDTNTDPVHVTLFCTIQTNTDPVHVMLFCTIQTLAQYMLRCFARYKQTLTQYMSCCFAQYKHWPAMPHCTFTAAHTILLCHCNMQPMRRAHSITIRRVRSLGCN